MNFRRVRIVCISDSHNQTPHLPPGDVLIHAGDLTQRGSPSELRRIFGWLDNTDFKVKIVVAGNHDQGLDNIHQPPVGPTQTKDQIQANINLLTSSPNLHYLQHESKVIELPDEDGNIVSIKVFGSPYSPLASRHACAFSYTPTAGHRMWESIPLDADIVVTHTPAKSHLDESDRHGSVGCEDLRRALWRVRPKLFVCGHIHEARGVEVVDWELRRPDASFQEHSVRRVEEGSIGSAKQINIDLSTRSQTPLQSDGSRGELTPRPLEKVSKRREGKVSERGRDLGAHSTRGRGGRDTDEGVDKEALQGRRGRQQTGIVNAALLTRKIRAPGAGGKCMNKVYVVDIDFPIVAGQEI